MISRMISKMINHPIIAARGTCIVIIYDDHHHHLGPCIQYLIISIILISMMISMVNLAGCHHIWVKFLRAYEASF